MTGDSILVRMKKEEPLPHEEVYVHEREELLELGEEEEEKWDDALNVKGD